MTDAEYAGIPIEGTFELPAVVRADASGHKPSKDYVVGNMVLHHSRHAVNGFQGRNHLGTGYSRPQMVVT